MTSQLSEGFPAHFCLLPGMVLPGHYLSPPPPPLSVRQSHRLWCMKSHIIWGNTLIRCLKACKTWWKKCWQTKCLWAPHRYYFLAAIWVGVWLWGQKHQGPECGNQLRPQVCQSGGSGGQTLWQCGHRTSHFSVNNLKNSICLETGKHGKKKKGQLQLTISGVYLLQLSYGFHTFRNI